ncbi:hypothetical protein MY10362_005126 [Beauveria mimosiformis]
MDTTNLLAVSCDAVLYAQGRDQYKDWRNGLEEEHIPTLEKFVTARIADRGHALFVPGSIREGSYNMVARFSFRSGGSDVALKMPKPGHSAGTLTAEKIANEASWMIFLKEKTTIPVPYVHSYGIEPGHLSPLQLPYILMDWASGDNLREFLTRAPSKKLVSTIYQQIASFYLEIFRVPCEGIGSVTKDQTTGQWSMERPLTVDMHQLVHEVLDYPTNDWPTEKFTNTSDYLKFVQDQQSICLWNSRNLNNPPKQAAEGHDTLSSADIARLRFQARYYFAQLSNSSSFFPQCTFGTFRAFNPDLDPRNMTVEPITGQILGVFDFEFTNAMPIQFACDPPLSLFRILPGSALDAGYFAWFLQEYEPILEQFLDAMEREEQKLGPSEQMALSARMRDSWDTKRVWLNFGLHRLNYTDALYWAIVYQLHPGGITPELPAEVRVEMERYVQQVGPKIAEYEHALISIGVSRKSAGRP